MLSLGTKVFFKLPENHSKGGERVCYRIFSFTKKEVHHFLTTGNISWNLILS